MNLRTYLVETKTTQEALAQQLGLTQSLIGQWVRGVALPPPKKCVEIEQLSGGLVTRRDLRPADWQEIWPELVWLQVWSEWCRAQRSRRKALRQFVRYGAGWLVALVR